MIDFLIANLDHIIRVQTKRGRVVKGRLLRVGRLGGQLTVDIKTKDGVRSVRVN